MGLLLNISLKKEDLDKLRDDQLIKGKSATYIPLTVSVEDKLDKFGNNASVSLAQSKDDRDAKVPRIFLGNGRVLYVGGPVHTAKELAGNAPEPF